MQGNPPETDLKPWSEGLAVIKVTIPEGKEFFCLMECPLVGQTDAIEERLPTSQLGVLGSWG